MSQFYILTVVFLLACPSFSQTAQVPGRSDASTTPDFSRYRLEVVVFEGARAFSPEQLRDAFHVFPGDKFNHIAVGQGLERLRRFYGDHGYINLAVVPTVQIEQDRGTVVLNLSIDEGSQFTFGRLFFDGQEPRAGEADALRNAWAALSGKQFNSSLLDSWLTKNATFLPKDGQPPSRHVELHQSAETRKADIGITFP
jgi:outer membrane protein assembly factor BamA